MNKSDLYTTLIIVVSLPLLWPVYLMTFLVYFVCLKATWRTMILTLAIMIAVCFANWQKVTSGYGAAMTNFYALNWTPDMAVIIFLLAGTWGTIGGLFLGLFVNYTDLISPWLRKTKDELDKFLERP